MGLSGFLYVAIVVGWAVYLVPFALKRYDEAARNRSIDRFSSAMRVLGRHDESADADVQTVATDQVAATPRRPRPPVADWRAQRAAARTAARRRRRVLLLLMFATVATAAAAWFLLVPMWSVAVPATLLLLWLLLCPLRARRERRGRAARMRGNESVVARQPRTAEVVQDVPAVSARSPMPAEEVLGSVQAASRPVDTEVAASGDEEPTVVLERNGDSADGGAGVGSGSLWDPVPVTLPTYVHKPRAPRTIRTIDLGSVGVQSSARTEDGARSGQTAQATQPGADGAAGDGVTEGNRTTSARAVGE